MTSIHLADQADIDLALAARCSSLTTICILRATIRSPSLPESPTARPPWREISATISLLILCSTISTASIVAASVTRIPRTKVDLSPSLSISSVICGPPPCTTTGLMPTRSSSTISCAKPSRSSARASHGRRT